MVQAQQQAGYALSRNAGVTDIWFPPNASRWTFKTGAGQTQGRLLQALGRESRGGAPPLHVHHDTDESWFVLDGELTIWVGDDTFDARAGDYVLGPMGVPHTYLVTSERAELLVAFAPAGMQGPEGAGLEGFFRDIGIPVVDGEAAPEPVPPDPEVFTHKAALYGIEIIGPPPTLP